MEDFVVSARKYRPETFDTVVGQQAITTTLKNAIQNGHLAQAFLFCGPRGVGKTTCARILARTINCMNLGPELEPCGECESCRGFKNNASQNIYELDAASNRSVDAMRALVEQVRIPPQVGKYKVYIIDEVHMLTSEAFNAFLKTLEEPPAYAKFILATTEKNKIIPTILSRCQIFDFKRIGVEDIVNHLKGICQKENISAEEEALRVIAQKADGGLRDALSMFDQIVSFSGNSLTYRQVISILNILDYETYFEVFSHFFKGDVPACLNLFNRVLDNGFDAHVFVNGLSDHLRMLLLTQDEATLPLMECSSVLVQRYREQTARCSLAQLLQALELCSQCDLQYRESNNKRLLVEMLLLQLIRVFAPASLGARGGEAPASVSGEEPAQPQGKAEPENSVKPVVPVSEPVKVPSKEAPVVGRTEQAPVAKPTEKDSRPVVDLPKGYTSRWSLKHLAEEKKEISASGPAPVEKKPVSETDFAAAWQRGMDKINESSPMLHSVLVACSPKLEPDMHITLHLANSAQQGTVEKEAFSLLTYLRTELSNTDLEFEFRIDGTRKETTLPYTPEEKYTQMAKANPEIRNFRESLHLEIDF